jgi:hypothetical protein
MGWLRSDQEPIRILKKAATPCAPRWQYESTASPSTEDLDMAQADVLWWLAEDAQGPRRRERWKDVARQYNRVIERGKGSVGDAAAAAILAWQHYFDFEGFGARHDAVRNTRLVCENDKKPCPIPEDQAGLLTAFNAYLAQAPDAPHAVPIKYTRATVFYYNNRFEEALAPLAEIVDRHVLDAEAIFAANLYLDSLNLLHRYQDLEQTVDCYLKDPVLMSDVEFGPQMRRLKADCHRLRGKEQNDRREYLSCARSFLSAVSMRPVGCERAANLFSASLCFHRAHHPQEAVSGWYEILTRHPRDRVAGRALLGILQEYGFLPMPFDISPGGFPDCWERP